MNFISSLFALFTDLYFTYLEINPLGMLYKLDLCTFKLLHYFNDDLIWLYTQSKNWFLVFFSHRRQCYSYFGRRCKTRSNSRFHLQTKMGRDIISSSVRTGSLSWGKYFYMLPYTSDYLWMQFLPSGSTATLLLCLVTKDTFHIFLVN